MASSSPQRTEDYEHRKLCAAREVYRRLQRGQLNTSTGKPWKDWWADMYGNGQSFDDYVRERRQHG